MPHENYKVAKREAKKVVEVAKCKAYDELYSKLGMEEMKTRDLNGVKCIRLKIKECVSKERGD
jgi:hypothetical protein